VTDFESITGKGAKARTGGITYFAGNQKLLSENSITVPEQLSQKAAAWSNESKTVIWFADSKAVLAVIAIADKVKETSAEAVKRLQRKWVSRYIC
jgi:P-type Cu2+ transporter